MRWTVLSSDALAFFPSVVYFIVVYYKGRSDRCSNDIAWHIAMVLLNPSLILIDHGHFQVWIEYLLISSLLFQYLCVLVPAFSLVFSSVQLYKFGPYCRSCGCNFVSKRSRSLRSIQSCSKSQTGTFSLDNCTFDFIKLHLITCLI